MQRMPQSVFCFAVPSSATSADSRSFHMASSSFDGAVPMRPGWIWAARRERQPPAKACGRARALTSPANLTPWMWRLVA